MRLSRRATLLGVLAAPSLSRAQSFPEKPLKLVVPYPPGGATDLLARMLTERMARELGQPVVIENRSGAGGAVGSEFAARAPADGYTILFGNLGPISLNPSLYANLPYDPARDFAALARLVDVPLILTVPTALDIHTYPQFLEWAGRNRGRVNFASVGNGSVSHLAGEMLNKATGLGLSHVPYRGGAPALLDVIAGNAQMLFATSLEAKPHLEGGRLRPLAITTTERAPFLPNVPTFHEYGLPQITMATWFGMLVPKATPAAVHARLAGVLGGIMARAEMRNAFLETWCLPIRDTPAEFDAFIASETRRFAPVVREAGVRIE